MGNVVEMDVEPWAGDIIFPPDFAGALLRGLTGRGVLGLLVRTDPAGRPSFLGRPTGRFKLFGSPFLSTALILVTLPFGRPGLRLTGGSTGGFPSACEGSGGASA